MVTANDIGEQIRYVVDGKIGATGRMTGLTRDGWAQISEALKDGRRRTDEFPAYLCEVVK
jgi:hypothetical protein